MTTRTGHNPIPSLAVWLSINAVQYERLLLYLFLECMKGRVGQLSGTCMHTVIINTMRLGRFITHHTHQFVNFQLMAAF